MQRSKRVCGGVNSLSDIKKLFVLSSTTQLSLLSGVYYCAMRSAIRLKRDKLVVVKDIERMKLTATKKLHDTLHRH